MSLAGDKRDAFASDIEEKFDFLFKQLSSVNNRELVDKYVTLRRVIIRKHKDKEEKIVVHDGVGDD